MPPRRSAAIVQSDLDELKAEYEREGINLPDLFSDYNHRQSALLYLRRHEGENDHGVEQNRALAQSLEESAAKYQKILNLNKELKRKLKEENTAAFYVFVIIFAVFQAYWSEPVLSFDEHQFSTLTEEAKNIIAEKFDQATRSKRGLLPFALIRLHELGALILDGNGSILSIEWYYWWQFNYIADHPDEDKEFHTALILDKSEDVIQTLLEKARQFGALSAHRVGYGDGWEYEYGTLFREFSEEEPKTLEEYRQWENIVNAMEIKDTCEAEEETPLLDVSMGIVRGDVGKYYDPTYILLDELGVMTDDVDDTDDVDEWLGINKEVHEVTRVVDECGQQCQNCKRRQFDDAPEGYQIEFYIVHSSLIRRSGKFKNHVNAYTANDRACDYILCWECMQHCVEKRDDAKYVWPAFYWRLLSGSHTSTFGGQYYNYSIYEGGALWRFIPQTMRPWWLEEVRLIGGMANPFGECTESYPPSIFEDRTTDLNRFNEDYTSGKLARVVEAMNNETVVNSNVLCPWLCSTSCLEAGKLPLDLMVQRMLPKIILPLFSSHDKYRNVHWCSNRYCRKEDEYPTIMLNDKWKVKPTVLLGEDGLQVLTCKTHGGGQDKLVLFPPESPSGHILNAEQSDQLSHCVKHPRVAKKTKAMKFCTIFGMTESRVGYAGADTMNVSTTGDFSGSSHLLSSHQESYVIGRPDINILLDQKVANREITPGLAEAFRRNAQSRYTINGLRDHTQGATYVSFEDMVETHLHETAQSQHVRAINDRPSARNRNQTLHVSRSWSTRINMLQTEDRNGFGSQFRPIPGFNTSKPSALSWVLFAIMSSCKELWHIVDNKPTPFRHSAWEGWILTAIQGICFQFYPVKVDKSSPFKKLTAMVDIADVVNLSVLTVSNEDDASSLYRFDIGCFRRLFREEDYSSSIAVIESFVPHNPSHFTEKKVVISVGSEAPTEGRHVVGTAEFELRVVCLVKADKRGDKFDAIRWMRHGCGMSSFWKQERNERITTQCLAGDDIYDELQQYPVDTWYFGKFVCVYVKCESVSADRWRSEFFKSLGGKPHVICQCCQFPLVPSKRNKENKLCCNMKFYHDVDGIAQENGNRECKKPESYVCSGANCNLRVCSRCYKELPVDSTTTIHPPETNSNELADDYQSQDDENVMDHDDDLSVNLERMFQDGGGAGGRDEESEDDDDSFASVGNISNGSSAAGDDFLVTTEQDTTLDLTHDNMPVNQGFFTTNSGDEPVNVGRDNSRDDMMNGHVMFNVAGSMTQRRNHTITGTSRQRHLVQSLCATSSGQASPLLQLEAALFPRHYYASAEHDSCSILGAMPLFLYTAKKSAHGFASMLSQARMHMTNPSSTTSTDPTLMCFYYDALANMALGSCHSRDVHRRGFVVDNKSAAGMAVREKDHTNLSESVDSRTMVLNLSASQQYVDWTIFLTFTANQKEHPGLGYLHEWKSSMEWTKNIPGYENLTMYEKEELKKSMEEAYAVHAFNNWNAAKKLLLIHIKEHLTCIGASSAIFARDEYQGHAGNLCHNHLILAIKKSSLNDQSRSYILDLIRTSSMEIIKPQEDLARLLSEGLLKSVDEVPEHVERADLYLKHTCEQRCQRRVGPGDTDDNFECRKMHSVKGNPDPTQHSYVPFHHDYDPATLEVLEEIGMYFPPMDVDNEADTGGGGAGESTRPGRGSFTHKYFTPERHIAPCNFNATDNMSPVICDFFVALHSMQNAQMLEHTNGCTKYCVKYITKFDEDNYVVLCQDIHTGEWVLGKTRLHNTKIVSSKINEDKAFEQQRHKNHPKGRHLAHLEIRQLLMGCPEVLTNLEFIQICTRPFEERPTNSINLDTKGGVIGDPNDGDHPVDDYTSGIPMQQIRRRNELHECQLMTSSQMATYRNHDGSASKYDMISLFSLRPPELICVFKNPVAYYRCCYIDKPMSVWKAEGLLGDNLHTCAWIDCVGRHVRIRELAWDEVRAIVQRNLAELEMLQTFSTEEEFALDMNRVVLEMINDVNPADDYSVDSMWVENHSDKFFYEDELDLLPVPVVSQSSPENAQRFLTHIILSLGEYETEMNALTHPTFRDSLRSVGLIGDSVDEHSLRVYARKLTCRYIEEQLVYYPNSLTKAEKFICLAKQVFDDAIVHNALSMSELSPYTMTGIRIAASEKNIRYWQEMKASQLQSVYNTLQYTEGVPSKDAVVEATRLSPLQWDPTQTLLQFENQSQESFEEQGVAIDFVVGQINKYRSFDGNASRVYTMNAVVHGAPGTGKSFVGQLSVLYAVSQGLNIISSALMGVRANAIGGTHIHKLFPFPTNGNQSPFRMAEYAMEKINRNPVLLHALLTVDIIFFDETGQISAEQLSAMEIVLRKKRRSQTPFGGVLILGTMDPSQLEPIRQLPFLVSSLMLTCFRAVELRHSVRAHGDVDFQRLQAITRMNPFELSQSPELKNEFFDLAGRVLTFVPNWQDPRITPNMMRAFSRIRPTQEALDEYRESIKRQLDLDGVDYVLSQSRDRQKMRHTHAEYSQASETSIKALNHELKEPSELVLFGGGLYECTINDSQSRFNQSQLAFMLDLPSTDAVGRYDAILLWIAPAGVTEVDFNHNNLPTRARLLADGWKETKVGVAPERFVSVRGGIHAKRLQFSLKHIGATTINKSQGATLPSGIAVEFTEEYSPWERGQVVVLTSRTTTGPLTVIVGEKNYAIKKMWELITIGNQWTRYTENVLKMITINGSGSATSQNIFDYPQVYPFRIQDITIPSDTLGYVYCLVSTKDRETIYIGQTKCLSQRLLKHNGGHGAKGTEDIRLRPWALAGFICGLGHMTKIERMSLECSWKLAVEDSRRSGRGDTFSWINVGARVVEEYNGRYDTVEDIRFIRCVDPESVS